ncbi:MAG: hypothetical protein AAF228_07790 [Pseudomonadota bacterium]
MSAIAPGTVNMLDPSTLNSPTEGIELNDVLPGKGIPLDPSREKSPSGGTRVNTLLDVDTIPTPRQGKGPSEGTKVNTLLDVDTTPLAPIPVAKYAAGLPSTPLSGNPAKDATPQTQRSVPVDPSNDPAAYVPGSPENGITPPSLGQPILISEAILNPELAFQPLNKAPQGQDPLSTSARLSDLLPTEDSGLVEMASAGGDSFADD